jgi:hypothetical protein
VAATHTHTHGPLTTIAWAVSGSSAYVCGLRVARVCGPSVCGLHAQYSGVRVCVCGLPLGTVRQRETTCTDHTRTDHTDHTRTTRTTHTRTTHTDHTDHAYTHTHADHTHGPHTQYSDRWSASGSISPHLYPTSSLSHLMQHLISSLSHLISCHLTSSHLIYVSSCSQRISSHRTN